MRRWAVHHRDEATGRPSVLTLHFACAVLCLWLLGTSASLAQATRPHSRDNESMAARPLKHATTTTAPSDFSANQLSWTKMGLSLGVVIAIILILRWVGARFFAAPVGGGVSRAVQVLSRTALSPKQQLMLVQVGRRVVLVANSGAQVNPLCEIRDADEVAELIGQIQREKSGAAGSGFAGWFRRAQEPFNDDGKGPAEELPDGRPAVDPEAAVTQQELHGLMDKVRMLSRQFRA